MNGDLSRGSWKIATVMGIPIRVHISWLIVFGLITWSLSTYYFPEAAPDLPRVSYWVRGAIAAIFLFASVLFHELSHSLVSRRYRMEILGITLFIFGGVAHLKGEPPTPRAELKIALAGPFSSFLLAGVFYFIGSLAGSPGSAALFAYLARINLVLGLFNLIPGFPMDGGRVLRAILWERRKDFFHATRRASQFGQNIALVFIVFGVLSVFTGFPGGVWLLLIGWFLFTAAQASYEQASLQEALAGVMVRDVMVEEVVTVDSSMTIDQVVDGFFLRYGFGGFPVFGNGRLLGFITLREVKDVPRGEWGRVRAGNVLAPFSPDWEISPEAPAMAALEKMVTGDKGRLVVIGDGRLLGLVTRNGIAKYVQIKGRQPKET